MLLVGSQRSRMLQLFTNRGLISWGDLSYCPGGATRRWLPPALIEQLLTFASDAPGDCPPHSHPPPRAGQFWLLKGTATERGGIYRLDALPSITTPLRRPTLERAGMGIGGARRPISGNESTPQADPSPSPWRPSPHVAISVSWYTSHGRTQ